MTTKILTIKDGSIGEWDSGNYILVVPEDMKQIFYNLYKIQEPMMITEEEDLFIPKDEHSFFFDVVDLLFGEEVSKQKYLEYAMLSFENEVPLSVMKLIEEMVDD